MIGMPSYQLPNFIVIGAPRAGTTSLHYTLSQHPEICMSSFKEPNFFAFRDGDFDFEYPGLKENLISYSTASLEDYLKLFSEAKNEVAIGEISPYYMLSHGAANRIQALIPSVKIIAVLRNPVDRAYSHFTQDFRNSPELFPDFVKFCNLRDGSDLSRWSKYYLDISLYYDQLKRYFDCFERGHIKILLYEKLISEPELFFKEVFRFLNIDESFLVDFSLNYNRSGIPKNKALEYFLSRNSWKSSLKKLIPPVALNPLARLQNQLRNKNIVKPQTISKDDRKYLIEKYFYQDILKVQGLTQIDLAAWFLDLIY
jgi:hypothetical protein